MALILVYAAFNMAFPSDSLELCSIPIEIEEASLD
jgi:hypothetical protein